VTSRAVDLVVRDAFVLLFDFAAGLACSSNDVESAELVDDVLALLDDELVDVDLACVYTPAGCGPARRLATSGAPELYCSCHPSLSSVSLSPSSSSMV